MSSPLDNLATETLLQIAKYFRVEFGGMPRQEKFFIQEAKAFTAAAATLRDLSLVCKELRPIAQENMVYSSTVLQNPGTTGDFAINNPDLVSFMLTLLDHPHLISHVKHLRVLCTWPPRIPRRNVKPQEQQPAKTCDLPRLQRLIKRACDIVDGTTLQDEAKKSWKEELNAGLFKPLVGVLLVLLHNLESLSLTAGGTLIRDSNFFAQFFGCTSSFSETIGEIQRFLNPVSIPGLARLKYLSVTFNTPVVADLAIFPALETLDIGFERMGYGMGPGTLYRTGYDKISTVRLDCRLYQIEEWHTGFYEKVEALLPTMTSLRSLELYGETAEDMRASKGSGWWSEYDRRDLFSLIACIKKVCPDITSLELPGGLWKAAYSSNAGRRTRLPISFEAFSKLERLVLPKLALLTELVDDEDSVADEVDVDSNATWTPEDEEDYRRAKYCLQGSLYPRLPDTLQHLTIFDADEEVLRWLEMTFAEEMPRSLGLKTVEVLMKDGMALQEEDVVALETKAGFFGVTIAVGFE